nr:alpha/beta fold hydrolase [Ktedonobacteraceae bacterium]
MLPYQLAGSGSPLLLVHGWGITYTVWRSLIPLLAPHFQLIMVELPGMGAASEVAPDKSYYPACAEALEELRVALGIEQWAILAYSTGTRASEAYMQRYPQHVTQAVFLCPIYLRGSWKLALEAEQWIDSKHFRLANWFFSDWRLYGLLLTLGFNLQRRDFATEWMSEITLQPLNNLKRMLLELPGKGRAPFTLPTSPLIPILFIWGSRDALTARPRRPRPNDVFIFANHGAPVLAPHSVAAAVLPFLKDGVVLEKKIKKRGKRGRFIRTGNSA